LYDPNNRKKIFNNLEEALKAASDCIDKCRPEHYGDSWYDETDSITICKFYPIVIYRATAVNIEPVMGEDEDGNEVETEDFNCNYEMKEEK
jgi:hypothetical protein